MRDGKEHVIVVGGGLAGLSAACYALASGFRVTIIEHNLALGGVCTAWTRSGYTVNGSIHWLTGGPFTTLYRELGIVPKVELRTLEELARYYDIERNIEVPVTRNLDALAEALIAFAPEDEHEIRRMVTAADAIAEIDPGVEHAPELRGLKESLSQVWDGRSQIATLVHYRKPLEVFAAEHFRSEALRQFCTTLAPPGGPALFLLFMLGYLERGFISRPIGGSGRFRDALVETFHRLGGRQMLHATVDEVLVDRERACGVRLADGRMLEADAVISTASSPETVLRLLGGRYGADSVRRQLADWKLFDPIVLVSFGLATRLEGVANTMLIRGIEPFDVGGHTNTSLYLRNYNDDPEVAPQGQTVLQAMLTTTYEWWATRGSGYHDAKDEVARQLLERLRPFFPDLARNIQMMDVATPLTYWNMARSWRGAYEGFLPRADSYFGHVKKTLPGLRAFTMAGQWVEPGGGVPTALLSGRNAVQLLCAEREVTFAVPTSP